MNPISLLMKLGRCLMPALLALGVSPPVAAQALPPAWDFAKHFQYHIEKIYVSTAVPGIWNVKVVFSIKNPTDGTLWNIHTALPYQSPGGGLTLDIGWDPGSDFTNTGSANAALASVSSTVLGTGPAMPLQVRNLNNPTTGAKACTAADCPGVADFNNRYWVQRAVSPVGFKQAVVTGRVGLEGHPVCNGIAGCPPPTVNTTTGALVYANIPVRSETADFGYVASATPVSAMLAANPRRPVVDFATKCANCHDGIKLDAAGTPIPRLSLHGNNRNENLDLCVMCHNPNQTDVPYRVISADARTSAAETSIDFKRMVHSIHAGGFRSTPYVVVGFGTSINDYSAVRFPGKLRNCVACHVDDGRKGTFELPLKSSVLGSTVSTGSVYAVAAGTTRTVDVNPANDVKITPIAATCSGCHDDAEVRSHMIRKGGASFGTLQQNIGATVNERCANCHGSGKEEDVRKAHEIRSSSGGSTPRPRNREH